MPLPPLLKLPDQAAYREHYTRNYCRRAIVTTDGIRVFFRQTRFNHAFYCQANKRGKGRKTEFDPIRAERMDWIRKTIEAAEAQWLQGYITDIQNYDPCRRVSIYLDDFVVVIECYLNTAGALQANFVTCFCADPRTASKITQAPAWNRSLCIDALKRKKNGR